MKISLRFFHPSHIQQTTQNNDATSLLSTIAMFVRSLFLFPLSAIFMLSRQVSSVVLPARSKLYIKSSSSPSTSSATKRLRVLALHGSEGNGLEFSVKLYPLRDLLLQKHNFDLQIHSISAPFPKGSGYAWWTMAPGERSLMLPTTWALMNRSSPS
jgi:hypothetical protein